MRERLVVSPLVAPIASLANEVAAGRPQLVAEHGLPVVEHDVDLRRGILIDIHVGVCAFQLPPIGDFLVMRRSTYGPNALPEQFQRLAHSISVTERHLTSNL